MSKADRDIDGKLDQRAGDTSPKVGDWEPSDEGIGCGALFVAIILALVIWGAMQGAVP